MAYTVPTTTVFSAAMNENEMKHTSVLRTNESNETMPRTKHGDKGTGISRYHKVNKMSLSYLMSHDDADLTDSFAC